MNPTVPDDLELLLTDDAALGRRAAEAILASDVAVAAALYLLRCGNCPSRA